MHISPNDTNSYRYLTLDNGLRALLMHDAGAQKSAAALAVNVGHFDDPADREGMAHYLEHMLFLGTAKYPKVGEFQNFISHHGGTNNAWTGTEHTCFFFDVTPEFFAPALDHFSQFFIAPLFNEEALDKERQAVESEYRLKLRDDSRRLYQVQKETINPSHPFSQFSVGNLETLGDRHDVSIRSEIIEFYHRHYSSDLMTLTVMGPQSLDELEQLICEGFSPVENRHLAGKSITIPFTTPEQTGIMIEVEPLKDLRKLILSFPLPNTDQYYQNKPLSYFAHLLGYEGENSLMLALKELGWITSLSAGGGASGSNYREFTVNCNLTPEGLGKVEEIIEALFCYIDLLRSEGLNEWRYQEKQAVLESVFRYQETTRPLDIVSHLVINMQHYQPEDTIYGDYMMSGYDEALLKQLLNHLVPENLRVTLLAKDGHYDHRAKWYDTPYSVTPFSEQQYQKFHNPVCDLSITLPPKNPYICYNLESKGIESDVKFPQLVQELPGFRLWHLQDTEFRVPKGVIYIAIDSPHSVASTRNIVMTRLCVEMFLDSLAKETYQAEIAGMSYNMYAHQGGVTLSISGFSQKQPELMKMILERFARRAFSQSRFDSIKQQLQRSWQNSAHDRPISQLFSALTGLLQPNNPPYAELYNVLETIEVDELPFFVEKILAQLHVEMFVYGDWRKCDALRLADTLKNALRVKDQEYEESLRPLVMLGHNGTFQKAVHCDQEDSAILVYYQSENTSPRSISLYSLANHLMSAAFFHEIRTKQQLGYMVGTGNMPLNRHPGLVLYVQSPSVPPAYLIAAIDEFLNALYMVLLELDEAQWESSKQGLINQIATPDPTLRSRAQRFWVAIGNKDLNFNQRELVLKEIEKLTRSDMIRFIIGELRPRTANRLIMHTQGNAHQEAEPLSQGQEISLRDLQLWPKACDLG